MRSALLLAALLATTCAFAALPPDVKQRQVADGVIAYEHASALPSSTQSIPSLWEQFFSLFHLQRQSNAALPFDRSIALLVGIGHYKHLTPSLD